MRNLAPRRVNFTSCEVREMGDLGFAEYATGEPCVHPINEGA